MLHTSSKLEDGLSGWFWVEEKINGPDKAFIRHDDYTPEDDCDVLVQDAIQSFIHYIHTISEGKAALCNVDCGDYVLTNLEYFDRRSVVSLSLSAHFILSLVIFLADGFLSFLARFRTRIKKGLIAATFLC